MEQVTLGRTGLRVSVCGLGCGGHSKLGRASGRSERDSIDIVRRALDMGVNHIDTAAAYGTEELVGKAIRSCRDEVVLATKVLVRRAGGSVVDAAELRRSVHESLARLGTDRVEILYLHGVLADDYAHCARELVPELAKLRSEGAIGFLGISENVNVDPTHLTLRRAVMDECWDVLMVGINLLNQSARESVLPAALRSGVGVVGMSAVRRALADPVRLRQIVHQLVADGQIGRDGIDLRDPLGFLVRERGAVSLTDAAYRFVRHLPGIHCVLTGSGDAEHLEMNVASLRRPPLDAQDLQTVRRLFGHLAASPVTW